MTKRFSFTATLVLLLCAAVTAQTTNDPVNLLLSNLPAGRDPQRYKGYVEPQFKAVVQRSFYLTMRDGVKIAVQLVLPKDLPADKKIPAIMTMTRYWRAQQDGQPNRFFLRTVMRLSLLTHAAPVLLLEFGRRRSVRTKPGTTAKSSTGSCRSRGPTERLARSATPTTATPRFGLLPR